MCGKGQLQAAREGEEVYVCINTTHPPTKSWYQQKLRCQSAKETTMNAKTLYNIDTRSKQLPTRHVCCVGQAVTLGSQYDSSRIFPWELGYVPRLVALITCLGDHVAIIYCQQGITAHLVPTEHPCTTHWWNISHACAETMPSIGKTVQLAIKEPSAISTRTGRHDEKLIKDGREKV